jgi:hypothetical protein
MIPEFRNVYVDLTLLGIFIFQLCSPKVHLDGSICYWMGTTYVIVGAYMLKKDRFWHVSYT